MPRSTRDDDAGAQPTDDDLLSASLDAFAESGYQGASVRKIARKLGVNHNYIPQRFGTKDRLWYAAVDYGFRGLALELFAVLKDAPADDLERLRLLMIRFLAANAARPALFQIINQEATTPGPRLEYMFERYIKPVTDLAEGMLETLHESGRVRIDSPVPLYFLVTHGAGGPFALPPLATSLGERIDPADADAVEAYARETVDLIFGGIVTDD